MLEQLLETFHMTVFEGQYMSQRIWTRRSKSAGVHYRMAFSSGNVEF